MVLGIDFGTKKTGLALGDEGTKIATPLESLTEKGEELLTAITDLVEMEDISKIVVGMPLSENGDETPQCAKVRDFVKDLKGRVEVSVTTVDEYLTTRYAQNVTRVTGGDTDAVAAAAILDEYFSEEDDFKDISEEETEEAAY